MANGARRFSVTPVSPKHNAVSNSGSSSGNVTVLSEDRQWSIHNRLKLLSPRPSVESVSLDFSGLRMSSAMSSSLCALLPSHVNQSQQCSQAHQVQRIPSERRRSYSDRASQCTSPFCSTSAVSVAVHHPVPQEAVRAVAQLQYGKPPVIPLLCHTVLDPQQ